MKGVFSPRSLTNGDIAGDNGHVHSNRNESKEHHACCAKVLEEGNLRDVTVSCTVDGSGAELIFQLFHVLLLGSIPEVFVEASTLQEDGPLLDRLP